MKIIAAIRGVILGIVSIAIYAYTIRFASKFFREYSHINKIGLLFGVISIMLIGIALIWLLFHAHKIILRKKTRKSETEMTQPKQELKEKEDANGDKKELKEKDEQKIRDKKIQKNYQKIFSESKKTLSPSDYKTLEEMAQYDILLYDALMVSRDTSGKKLQKIESEKGKIYTEALKKVLK